MSSGVTIPEDEGGLEETGVWSGLVVADICEVEGGRDEAAEDVARSGSLVVRLLGANDTWETAALRGGLADPFTPPASSLTPTPPPTMASLVSPRITT